MTILKNIVSFNGLLIGVPVALPHGLNVNGTPVAPQLVLPAAGGYTITANATTITVLRLVAGGAAVRVFAERWHSIEDVTPATELAGLVPFIPNLTGVGVVVTDGTTVSGDGSVGSPLIAQGAISPLSAIHVTSTLMARGLNRYANTVGAIAALLPSASLYTAGELFGFTSVGAGLGPINLTPDFTDTIVGTFTNGAPLAVTTPARGYVLVSDGVANWYILGTYPP